MNCLYWVKCDAGAIRESPLRIFRLCRKNTRYLYDATLCLDDLDRITRNFQADAGLGHILEMFENQAIQRFRAVQRQVQSQLAVQFAQAAAAFQHDAAVFLAQEFAGLRGGLGGEFPDDFFQDVFQRHQAEQLAVFIHHQPQPCVAFLELLQLLEQRRVGGDEIGFIEYFAQLCHVQRRFLQQRRHALDMQDADDVAGHAVINRQQGVVAGNDLLAQFVCAGVDVQRLDLVARNHHVVHGDALQVDQVQQHLLVLVRQEMLGVQHQSAQFLDRHFLLAPVGLYLDSEHTKQPFDNGGRNRNHRMEQG